MPSEHGALIEREEEKEKKKKNSKTADIGAINQRQWHRKLVAALFKERGRHCDITPHETTTIIKQQQQTKQNQRNAKTEDATMQRRAKYRYGEG